MIAYLRVAQVVKSLLIRSVCLLQIIHHKVTVAQATPSLSAARVKLQNILQVLNRFGELFLCAKDTRDGVHSWNRPLVVTQSLFISIHSTFQIAHQFGQASYRAHSLALVGY